jgi:phosphatidylserine decarboxylase
MPCDGVLAGAWFVPGRLFSVNQLTAARVPGLFARNERVILSFDSATGPFAVVLVGALNVGSIDTVWHGNVAPMAPRVHTPLVPRAGLAPPALTRGAELGRFNMGSTVILLLPPGGVRLDARLAPGVVVRMGEAIGRIGA